MELYLDVTTVETVDTSTLRPHTAYTVCMSSGKNLKIASAWTLMDALDLFSKVYGFEKDSLNGLRFQGSRVYIPSFCNVGLGESLFNDPRSYFSSLTRNAEAFSEIASRLKDSVFLTDDEIFAVASRYAAQEFNIKQLAILTPEQKIHLAKDFRTKTPYQQICPENHSNSRTGRSKEPICPEIREG